MFLATRRVAGRPVGSPIPGQLPPNPIFLPPSLVLFSYPMLQGRTGSLGWLLLAVPSLSVLPRESPTSCAPGAEGTILELLGPALAAPTLNCKAADAAIQGPPGLETEAGWGQELSGAREATISKGVPPLPFPGVSCSLFHMPHWWPWHGAVGAQAQEGHHMGTPAAPARARCKHSEWEVQPRT